MENSSGPAQVLIKRIVAHCAGLLLGVLAGALAHAAPPAITVIGVDQAGNQTPVTNYRWTIEEDATKASLPGVPANLGNYSYNFHTSYMPVIAAGKVVNSAVVTGADGNSGDPAVVYQPLPNLNPAKRYFISVLPNQDGPGNGYQMGASPVAPGQTAVTIYVNKYPVPTAQLSVFVFGDNHPLNSAPDLPEEVGLAGFTVELLEAGGTYGASGGAVTQDAFANPLGTTYVMDANGQPVLNPASEPTMLARGSGILVTDAHGHVLIKNLFPAKYTILVHPPVGSDYVQTSTIEGTKGDDAWVKNGEPPFFQEFGPPGHHVFVGFTHRGVLQPALLNGNKSITGKVVNIHNSRPPDYAFYNGAPVPDCWVGLNEPNQGRTLYTTACDANSNFTIPNVPAGTWELVVWDEKLDMIIAMLNVTVDPLDTVVNLVEVPVFGWFATFEGRVFNDANETGFPLNANGTQKPGMPNIPLNIRFRDGSIYQSTTTKQGTTAADTGKFAFNELFPFFNWMIAEVDYARFKATGATIVVDAGGPVPQHNGWTMPSFDRLNPQPQFTLDPVTGLATNVPDNNPNTGNNLSKTEKGPVLLEGMQAFLGESVHIEFGKKAYAFGENGGIAGIVHYAITRAEDDPSEATAENWEPGIPRVQINLFLDCNKDGKPDQPNPAIPGKCLAVSGPAPAIPDPALTYNYVAKLPDVDNFPFCWRDPESCGLSAPTKGAEDIVRSGDGVTYSYGDAFTWGTNPDTNAPYIGVGKTDGWDDAIPTGCQPDDKGRLYQIPYGSDAGKTLDCYDGLRVFNQVRPAVFDGGYGFGRVAFQSELPLATYVVEAVAPPGYRHQGNGDQNVYFGDSVGPTPDALPLKCVGMELPVPQYLNLFSDQQVPNPSYAAGKTWKKCDMKSVPLGSGTNPAPDFHMFTEAPVAGHGVGFILDDMASEFDANAPTFGEKHALPWLPISIRDWTGREIQRVYSDQFGSYNFLVPSTFTINPPFPSGVSPNMIVSCMNSPGPILDTVAGSPTYGKMIIDPHFDRQYSQFCYTLQYLPGKTTYLDTPVVPVAAFAGPGQYPLDCDFADGTPVIYSVEGINGSAQNTAALGMAPGGSFKGPFVRRANPAGTAPNISTNQQPVLTIVSVGTVQVSNPNYDPAGPDTRKTIARNYGFGKDSGTVTLNGVVLPLLNGSDSWTDHLIQVRVPNSVGNTPVASGQLMVKRKNDLGGLTSTEGVYVTVAPATAALPKVVMPGQSIQAVIDDVNTVDGDLVLIAPGTYNEFVIMDKKLQLQGWGAPSVVINAAKFSSQGLKNWRTLLDRKLDAQRPACAVVDPDTGVCPVISGPNRTFDPLPGQVFGHNISNNEPLLFGAEEGPGILVVAANPAAASPRAHRFDSPPYARIDGMTITGADYGGGILASGYARYLQISNNRVTSNYGTYGGGIRIGHTELLDQTNAVYGGYTNSGNGDINIHHNWVSRNGSTESGAGGGITLGNGSSNYSVTSNYICGNFSMADGGGIGHLGLSDGGLIKGNTIIFNQTFNQSANPTGAGIFIGGEPALAAGLSAGSGSVTIDANLIQGNNAGAGEGAGIQLLRVNGRDVSQSPNNPAPWYKVDMTNNMIVNNVAGYAGAGVSLTDALVVNVVNNTIANNDSTATSQQSFGANRNLSNPQPAGLVAHATSAGLQNAIGALALDAAHGNAPYKSTVYANPRLLNNILWHNRSFYWRLDANTLDPATGQPVYGVVPANPLYVDLAVLDTPNQGTFAGGFIDGDKLSPEYSVLSGIAGYGVTNLAGDPRFVRGYLNGNRKQSQSVTEVVQTAITFDEGGNFIDVRYGPLTLWNQTGCNPQDNTPTCPLFGDYHIQPGGGTTSARGNGQIVPGVTPVTDFDAEPRPQPAGATTIDIGADERP
jgi:hypothetical protein